MAQSVDTLRVATYNILNYPGGQRDPEFRRIVHGINPDVLVIQEMTSQAGMTQFLTAVLNYYAPGEYLAVLFNDGPDTDNGFFYKPGRVTFLSASYIQTALRNIAEYALRPSASAESLRIYSVHLKAGQDPSNEQQRLAEATILRNHLNNLPSGAQFAVLGDFNIYRSDEPAFQKLIGNEGNNNGRLRDPLSLIGIWNNNPAFSHYHTQSSRVRSFGGGATGGLDDRFDMILASYSLDDNILVASYTEYGNDGNHFNDSINRPPNTQVPDTVANALHNASDHLPVFADFVFAIISSTPPTVTTNAASGIATTSAALNGTVNPNGSSTDVWFEWGGDLSYGNNTTLLNIGNGTIPVQTNSVLTGLLPSTLYHYRVAAVNSTDTSFGSNESFMTLPAVPPHPPTLVLPPNAAQNQPLAIDLCWNPSPGAEAYRVQVSTDSLFSLLFINDSTITDTTSLVEGLSPNNRYYWRVSARSTGGAGGFSTAWSFGTTGEMTGQFIVNAGWNMISLPLGVNDPAPAIIYPTATSGAFFYAPGSGYQLRDTLNNGPGYWLKFDSTQTLSITGWVRTTDTIDIETGWNMIGSISFPVDTADITVAPPGIITSTYFAYSGGYLPVSVISPGMGYWVKASATGQIILSAHSLRFTSPSRASESRNRTSRGL